MVFAPLDTISGKETKNGEGLLFLSEIGKVLSSSLNYNRTLRNVAKLVVPRMADWVIIDIVEDDKSVTRVAIYHRDKKFHSSARKLQKEYHPDMTRNEGVPKVIKSGISVLDPVVSTSVLRNSAQNEEHLKLMFEMGFTSGMCLALKTRSKVLGAMTLICGVSKRSYTKADFILGKEIASRVALAIDNSRLYTNSLKSIKLRDDFISIASHEMKTPLTSLKLFSQSIEKQLRKEGKIPKSFEKINTQIEKLNQLVSDLLDVSRIQGGKLDLDKEQFLLEDLLNEVIDNVHAVSSHHTIEIQGNKATRVTADRNRIGQVLINLLTNAIKYSPDAPFVTISIEKEKNVIIVGVTDYGIGIDKNHQKKIFEKFYRVTSEMTMSYPGLGIGLFISHDLISRHGGRMWVKSEKGKGSSFYFSLPT